MLRSVPSNELHKLADRLIKLEDELKRTIQSLENIIDNLEREEKGEKPKLPPS